MIKDILLKKYALETAKTTQTVKTTPRWAGILFNKMREGISKVLDKIPSNEKKEARNIVKIKTPTDQDIQKAIDLTLKYIKNLSPSERRNIVSTTFDDLSRSGYDVKDALQKFETKYKANYEKLFKPSVKEELDEARGRIKELHEIYTGEKSKREELEQQVGKMQEETKKLEGMYAQEKAERERIGKQLGEEVERKRTLGRAIRYGVPGVGGFGGGLLLGPIWGPIIGAGLGAGTTFGVQLMEGESPTDWKAYIGPTATGVGTSIVGALLRHIIHKRRKNI
jgi:hypothetical protein